MKTEKHNPQYKRLDRTGIRYGRLVVLSLAYRDGERVYWICQCDCGNLKQVLGQCLTQGYTKSCGCLAREARAKPKVKLEKTRQIYRANTRNFVTKLAKTSKNFG